MKKFLSIIFFAFMAVTMFAQSNETYRLVVHKSNGTTQGFSVQNVDSISFKKVTNEVGVEVDIKEINRTDPENEYVIVSVTPSEVTKKYRFTLAPKTTADVYRKSVEDMRMYFDPDPTIPTLTEAVENAQLSGFNFKLVPGVFYSIMVLSYNELDEPVNAQTFDFQVPEVELIGDPSVDIVVSETTPFSISISFKPNEDCLGYYICCFEPGLAEKQFNEFGALMGFACMGDMIKSFGKIMHEGEYTTTWNDMVPGMDYEVYAQPLDKNGNYAPMCITVASTPKIGGEGLAEMTIELGNLKEKEQGYGYLQEISFIPNDQTMAHRDIVAMKSAFDNGTWTEESLLDYMKHDTNPDYPDFIIDPDWDQYGVHTGDFPVSPGDTYYVYSIGKNANGEYGPFVKKEFTVPENPKLAKTYSADKNSLVKEIGTSKDFKLGNGQVLKRSIIIKK